MTIVRLHLKLVLRYRHTYRHINMSDKDVPHSSKRALSGSPLRTSAEDSERPTKKPTLEQDVPTVTEESQGSQSQAKDREPDEEAAANAQPRGQGSSSTRLVGQGRKGYKGKNGGTDRRDAVEKRNWHHQQREGKREPRADKEGSDGEGEKAKRLPKKKVAILLGYCGAGYSGMQIQTHGAKTIEGDFFDALIKAGAVSPENAVDHRKVDVQRAARTDAGVHAAGNCISMKMILGSPVPPEHKNIVSYVNSFLPDQIRMWGFVRTVKSFQARLSCDSRIYEYVLPSYCLLPPSATDPLAIQLDDSSPGWRDGLGLAAEFADAGAPLPKDEPESKSRGAGDKEVKKAEEPSGAAGGTDPGENKDEDNKKREEREKLDKQSRGEYERRRGYRVDKDTLERFRALVDQFTGTHNFHNYTVGKPFNDRTVKRYMMSLVVRDPQLVGDIEWISVQIHGQSFMLHQIRKMISIAMLACRTNTPASLIPETFGPKNIHIPKAPPLGLLLEAPQFGTYNLRVKEGNSGDAERDQIDWSLYADQMQDFRLKFIYEKLRQDELESHIFHKWLRQIDCTSSDILSFLNTKGVIPDSAQVQPGRDKPKDGQKNGGKKDQLREELESDEEEVDQDLLKRGELEG